MNRSRRTANRIKLVIVVDLLAAIIAAPLAVVLGHVDLPGYDRAVTSWLIIPLVMMIVFRRFRLYSSLWRFASSSDFMNIASAVAVTASGAFILDWILTRLGIFPPIDGRVFLIFGLLLAVFVSLSRLTYRSLSDRFAATENYASKNPTSSAIFVGTISEAALAMRQLSHEGGTAPRLAAIISTDKNEPDGTYLSGVIIRRDLSQLNALITASKNGSVPLTHVIIGSKGFASDDERVETIRKARAAGMTVMAYRGVESMGALPAERLLREVDLLSMLNRQQHRPDEADLVTVVARKRVIVTGGAGSIGGQLARRCLTLGAAQVIIVDRSETAIFHWMGKLPEDLRANAEVRVADVSSHATMSRIFREFNPDIVFHAAALKHVPLVETNWTSAIDTNVVGTWTCANLSNEFNVERFVFISTDKAVEPTTFLGQTKRLGELMCGSLNQKNITGTSGTKAPSTRFTAVRFGNVFGTEGSVVNIFEDQIKSGGPVTITHPNMRRYFMTSKEASDLVILSAAIDSEKSANTSQIYVLEMGEQIKITDIADAMIRLSGKNPGVDMEIKYTGIRQHEKLEEKLVSDSETVMTTENKNVLIASCPEVSANLIDKTVQKLVDLTVDGSLDEAIALISAAEQSAYASDGESRVIPLPVGKQK